MHRYERPLYSYLVRYLLDSHQAEDVFQETFMRLARSADEFDAKRLLRPWLYTIGANLARDLLRKRKIRRSASLDSSARADESPLDARKQDADPGVVPPPVVAERSEEALMLHEGIDLLRPDYRDVVRMHFFQGMKYRDIAESLTIPLGTVKSRIHAALRQLETYLTEQFGDVEVEKPWTSSVKTTIA